MKQPVANIFTRSGIALIAAALCGCAGADNEPEPGRSKTYTGIYLSGFEISSFVPDGVREQWWMTGDLAPVLALEPIYLSPGVPEARVAKVSVVGVVTERGFWGHIGSGERELKVTRVSRAETASMQDFKRAVLAGCKLPLPEGLEAHDVRFKEGECDALRAAE